MSDFMLMADLAVNLPNDLPGGATPQAAIRDDDGGSPGDTLAEYAYLGIGRIVQEDYPEPEVRLDYDSGTPGDYAGFDRFGRVIDHRWYAYAASADRDRYTYGYDRASNRLYRENTITSARDELYGYDGVNRLATFARGDLNGTKDGITGTAAREEDWSLDMTGNWPGYVQKTSGTTDLDQGRTHNPVNEITAIAATTGTDWADPVHDRNGNMTTIPKPASLANGLTATYDAWNRLVEVKDGATVVARYEYDALARRVRKHLDSDSPGSLNGINTYVHYYYNGAWQTLETRRSTSADAQPETLQPRYQYVWARRYIDALVLRDVNTEADGLCDDGRIYCLGDANFNITTLVDTAGDPLERYVYSPYGVLTIHDATWSNLRATSSHDVEYTYTGRRLDGETGMYYYRHRMYHGQLGRFCSADPLGYADTFSMYEAAFAPNEQDPFGRRKGSAALLSFGYGGFPFELPSLGDLSPIELKKKIDELTKGIDNKTKEVCKAECEAWVAWDKAIHGDAWLETIPKCPCKEADVKGLSHLQRWWPYPSDRGSHPGCNICYRSVPKVWPPKPDNLVQPGQQCCYDKDGNLITEGTGAGTPDYVNAIINPGLHFLYDVYPYLVCKRADMLDEYLKRRPNDPGVDKNNQPCPRNPTKVN